MPLLFVGLATVDVVQRVARFPGIDEKVQSASVEVAAGGPAANAAVTAAALGAEVTLISAVGSHPLGELVRADLAAHGVTLIDADPRSPEPPPVSAVTVLAATGERTIVSRNAGNRAVAVPPGGLPDADLTLVDGHHPALAVAAARSARRLLVDAGSWRPVFTDVFPYAEVVACSGDFRHPACSPAAAGDDDPAPAGDDDTGTGGDDDAATAAAVAAPHVVITHGPEPVRWFSAPDATGRVPVPSVAAVDTAGAGDAFHGALAVALARGDLDLPAAIAFASRVAAIRVSHAGPRSWLAHLR
ncbi:PfkB family carbohydrate kinase [Actinoplanes utahensis]|uniref:Carbohydrate kinase n=1 Tax=Actinoplanes utahensis TaxID=1869 RepID=A0A0A6UDB0_ACTUT|nr:PfkB family carbohydrate kinase [Actinoplanes utahensis]KHD72269.1 carbohydrate kinase [Actinoplanes utahensis]GIF35552.1 kinase [Actinoplanes utahensis]